MKHKVFCLLLLVAGCALLGFSCLKLASVPQNAEFTALMPTAGADAGSATAGQQLLSYGEKAAENSGLQVSVEAIADGISLTGSLSRTATVTVYGIGPGWFDTHHRTLLDGRTLGEE